MASPIPPPTAGSFMNNPLINAIVGYIGHLQAQNFFTKERLQSVKHHFLITIGFLILLYCLIYIQILFFWLFKFLFRLLFQIISILFWLPLKTVRFLIPKTIDYDILFPLFWLCSISSFYLSKFFHENICQFYDQQLVRRYKLFSYDQSKREEIKRYLFIVTFIVLLLLQSLFILIPIAVSIRHQHENTKVSSIPMTTTTTSTTIVKTVVNDVVDTMSGNLYNRFIEAFTDENETHINEKRSPLISDEKLEDSFKTIQKSIEHGIKQIQSSTNQQDKKSSRFQRWIVHYLKAPFQKWESKKNLIVKSTIEDEHEENEEENDELDSSSSDSDTDETDDEEDDASDTEDEDNQEEHTTITEKIKQRFDTVKHLGEKLKENIQNKLSSSKDEDRSVKDINEEASEKLSSSESDDESTTVSGKLKEQMKNIAEKVGNQIRDKYSSSPDNDDEDSGYDSDDEEPSPEFSERIRETLAEPIENKITSSTDSDDEESPSTTEQMKDLGEKVLTNIKHKLSSSTNTDEEDSKIESDEENEEEHSSILNRVKQNIIKPIENLRDKLPSLTKHDEEEEEEEEEEEDLSLLDRTKQTIITPITDKISSNAEELIEKAKQIKETLPTTDKVISTIKQQIESKASDAKAFITTNTEHLKEKVVDKIKSLKKKKKPSTLTEKAKDKFKSLRAKLPSRKKKKPNLLKTFKSKLKINKKKLNGWFDEGWNIWHLTKRNFARLFSSSTRHARHLPRYNTTSLYTAYTDVKCYDYTKKLNRYRLLNQKHWHFLDTYRHHSPFPVYLSVLKSNGPKCYRQYPDSSCGVILKSSSRSFKTQLYRFIRFWALISLLIVILAVVYKKLTQRKQSNPSSSHQHEDFDRSSNKKNQKTTISNQIDSSKSTTTTTTSANNQQKSSSNTNTRPLYDDIEKELQLWLQHEQNDGFRNLSETCRLAINDTFLKQLERLSVETLQFANAKIHNVSQNNNKTGEISTEKIVINAVLDIDHLILNIVNTFKEQHFSLETPKLSGQLYVLLVINPNQYSIEANLKQLQINPVNIIDPNNALSADEKHSIVKLFDETINRTVIRCSFRLSDNQENTNYNTLYNSSPASRADANKTYSSSNQLSTSSIPTITSRSRQPTPNRYQPSEPLPTVLINDVNQHLYTNESQLDKEPKRLLIRIVKAVKLHDVEQPYCILELNHPKQIQRTSLANNGLNPFWDERFLFECDDQSNQIHLQIIDHKKTNQRTNSNYVDIVYADVLIPFSYVTSTVYKQDVQISPQYPESIIRIEFSTLSEEEALAANNGYDIESLTDSQIWTYNEREANKIEHDYPQRYPQSPSNDFLSSSYDTSTLPKHYGLSTSLYDDERDYSSTLPRSADLRSNTIPFSPSSASVPRNGGLGDNKPQKSKSFMSSLKHLTLPRRKHRNKDKHDNSMTSQTNSFSQLNTSLQSPQTNPVSHSLSSALPGPNPEHFLTRTNDGAPVRRSRSISQSFKNLFRSNSKKRAHAAKTDALGEFENGKHSFLVENRNYQATSTPTTKKLSFLQRRKSKQKAKQQTNFSTNSLSSYDCSRLESVRDTPIRANVGHPVTMTKTLVQ